MLTPNSRLEKKECFLDVPLGTEFYSTYSLNIQRVALGVLIGAATFYLNKTPITTFRGLIIGGICSAVILRFSFVSKIEEAVGSILSLKKTSSRELGVPHLSFIRKFISLDTSEQRISLIKENIQLNPLEVRVLVENLARNEIFLNLSLDERVQILEEIAKNKEASLELRCSSESFGFQPGFMSVNEEEKMILLDKMIELGCFSNFLIENFRNLGFSALDFEVRLNLIQRILKSENEIRFLKTNVSLCKTELIRELNKLNTPEKKIDLVKKIVKKIPETSYLFVKYFKEYGLEGLNLDKRLEFLELIKNEESIIDYLQQFIFFQDFQSCKTPNQRLVLVKRILQLGTIGFISILRYFKDLGLQKLEFEERACLIKVISETEKENNFLSYFFYNIGFIEDLKEIENSTKKLELTSKIIQLGRFGAQGIASNLSLFNFELLTFTDRIQLIKLISQEKTGSHELILNSLQTGFVLDIQNCQNEEEKLALIDQILEIGALGAAVLAKLFHQLDLKEVSPEKQLSLIQKISLKKKETFLDLSFLDELCFFENIQHCKNSKGDGVAIEMPLFIQIFYKIKDEEFKENSLPNAFTGCIGRQLLIEGSLFVQDCLPPPLEVDIEPIIHVLIEKKDSLQDFRSFLLKSEKLRPFSEIFERHVQEQLNKSNKIDLVELEHLKDQLWRACAYMAGVFYDLDQERLSAFKKNSKWIEALLAFPNPKVRFALIRQLSYLNPVVLNSLSEETPLIKIRFLILLSNLESIGILNENEKNTIFSAIGKKGFFKDTKRQIVLYDFLLGILNCNPLTKEEIALVKNEICELLSKDLSKTILSNTINKIESLNQILGVLGKESFFRVLHEKKDRSYGAFFEMHFKDLFDGLEQISDLQDKYKRTFASFRDPQALFSYLNKINQLSQNEKQLCYQALSQYVVSVLEGEFQKLRYSTENHPHLERLFEDPTIKEKWLAHEEEKELILLEEEKAPIKRDLKSFFYQNIITDRHLNPIEYPILTEYLEGGRNLEDLLLDLEDKITEETNSILLNKLNFQKNAIELCEERLSLEDFFKLRFNTIPSGFAAYMDVLKERTEKTQKFTIMETDNPCDLLLLGTEIIGSCQNVHGDPNLNKGLLGYLLNGEIKAIVIKDQNGKIVVRSLIRLLLDGDSPILLQERIYNNLSYLEFDQALINWSIEKAEKMGTHLVSNEVGKGLHYNGKVLFLGGRSPFVYSDATHSIQEGAFEVRNTHVLYENLEAIENKKREISKPVTIHQYISLDIKTQRVALQTIARINQETSTQPGTTWENYTKIIKERIEESKETLFLAKKGEKFVGYCVFYLFEGIDGQPYCSWTAVDQRFRRQNIAMNLKLKIFEIPQNFQSFTGHIRKTNKASLGVLEEFKKRGHSIQVEEQGERVFYTVHKFKEIKGVN